MPGLPIKLVIWHLHSHHEGHSTLNAFSFSICWKNIWSSSQFKKWYWRQNCWRSRSWWRRISMASFLEKICWIWWKSFVSLSVYSLLDKSHPTLGTIYKNLFYRCGGSIMNENWVLSAGHCCAGLGDDGEIVAGTNDR